METIINELGPFGLLSIAAGIVFLGLFFIAKKQHESDKKTLGQ